MNKLLTLAVMAFIILGLYIRWAFVKSEKDNLDTTIMYIEQQNVSNTVGCRINNKKYSHMFFVSTYVDNKVVEFYPYLIVYIPE